MNDHASPVCGVPLPARISCAFEAIHDPGNRTRGETRQFSEPPCRQRPVLIEDSQRFPLCGAQPQFGRNRLVECDDGCAVFVA